MIPLQAFQLPPQSDHLPVGGTGPSVRERLAGGDQSLERPALELVVPRQGYLEGRGRLRRGARPGQHFQHQGRNPLGLQTGYRALPSQRRLAVAARNPGPRPPTPRGRRPRAPPPRLSPPATTPAAPRRPRPAPWV